MRTKSFLIVIAVIAATATACKKLDLTGLLAASSINVESRFKESEEWNRLANPCSLKASSDNYELYILADIHLGSDGSNLQKFVNKFQADPDAEDFVICLGDLIDNNLGFDNFCQYIAPIMDSQTDTMLFAIGNHDLYFNQWNQYKDRFHTSTYYFEVSIPSGGKDLFISIDSGNGTIGRLQREWLEQLLSDSASKYRNVIVMTHTHFFMLDYSQGLTGNYSIEETYYLTSLFARYGVDLVLTGHDHRREDQTFKGVRYIIIDALMDGYYATIEIGDDISVKYRSLT